MHVAEVVENGVDHSAADAPKNDPEEPSFSDPEGFVDDIDEDGTDSSPFPLARLSLLYVVGFICCLRSGFLALVLLDLVGMDFETRMRINVHSTVVYSERYLPPPLFLLWFQLHKSSVK